MLDFPVYLLYRGATAILATLPLRLLFRLGNIAGFCAWLTAAKYRRLASRNLALALQNKTPCELRPLIRRHFQRLGANLLCSVKLTRMRPEEILRHLEVENVESVDRQLRDGVPVVLVLSHLGTWELFAQLMPHFLKPVQVATVYQSLRNRYIDEHIRQVRSGTNLTLFDRKEGFQPVIDLLRSGGGVGILSDQHAGDHGLWTPFFGRLAATSPLPALLARRTRAALIAGAIYTIGPARWRMVFTERFDESGGSVEALTAKSNQIIEQQVGRAPEDWFWVHNRWKTPRPNFLLARYKRGVYLPSNLPAEDLKPFRILIRSSNWLGDAVLSAPAVRAIKAGRPDARVTVLAPEKIAPLWRLTPEVDEILSFEGKSLLAAVRVIRRHQPFDVAMLFPNSLRAALEVWLGRVPRRVGYRGHWRSWLLNQIVREPAAAGPIQQQSNRYLRIAQECGAQIDPSEKKTLNTRRSTSNAQLGPGRTSKIESGKDARPFRLALAPGAEYGPAKRWLPERFAEAAVAISAQSAARWVLLGTSKDAEPGQQIASVLGENCVNRIGQTTLDQLIEELRGCRLLLTNDTGTMHLAALLGLPVVAIFGSTEPALTGPLGAGHIILRHHVECSPCFLRECPIDFRCMKAVTVQEVVHAVMSILEKSSPK